MPRRSRAIDPTTVLTKRQMDNARLAIKSSQIIKRLQKNFDGQLDNPLTPSQLKSAELLLNRSLPVLQALEVTHGDLPPTINAQESIEAMDKLMLDYATSASNDVQKELRRRLHGGRTPVTIDEDDESKVEAS